jgi:histone H4
MSTSAEFLAKQRYMAEVAAKRAGWSTNKNKNPAPVQALTQALTQSPAQTPVPAPQPLYQAVVSQRVPSQTPAPVAVPSPVAVAAPAPQVASPVRSTAPAFSPPPMHGGKVPRHTSAATPTHVPAPSTGRVGVGKGRVSSSLGGQKRHRKIVRDSIQGVTKSSIRRLARRGGCKRLSGLIYDETRNVLQSFLKMIVCDAALYTEHARRKTLTAMDVICALKRQGRTLYGFGG